MNWAQTHKVVEDWLDEGCPEFTEPGKAARMAMCIGAILLDHKKVVAERGDVEE